LFTWLVFCSGEPGVIPASAPSSPLSFSVRSPVHTPAGQASHYLVT